MFQLSHLRINIPKRGYFAAGLLLRLFLAPFLSHPFDMRTFMAVGAAVSKGITPYGQYILQDIFAATPHPHLYGTFPGIGYPPLWGLITGEMYSLSYALAPNNLYAYVLALKIPIILGELALALIVYNILKAQANEKIATATFLLFIFCPFIISIGTIWGMFDVIALVFALLSAYSLQRNWKLSSVFLSLSSTLKVFPLILAPLYSIVLHKTTRNAKIAIGFLLSTAAIAGVLTFLPIVTFSWPVSNMYNALTYHVATTNPSYDALASFPYGAASPFNAFGLLGSVAGGSIEPPWETIYIWIPACIVVYALLFRARLPVTVKEVGVSRDFALTVQWSLLLLLTFFTTRAWISEQNLIFLFVFFSLSVFLQYPRELNKVQLLWLLLFVFVLVHVPVISFFWLPLPWTLNAAVAFADGPFGWTRLLLMTALTFSWLAVCWQYVARKLRWR
jgi:hypothetical protein